MSFFSQKKFLLFGFILVLLTVIPITVFYLQQQQEVRSRAAPATTLSFSPASSSSSPIAKNVGQVFDLDVTMTPDTNQVIATKLVINYDKSKLATEGAGLVVNATAFPSILEGPTYTDGVITVTMTVGIDITKAIRTQTKVATITFKAKDQTVVTPTQVTFSDQTNVTSTSDPEANVLSLRNPSFIAIGAGPTGTPGPTGITKPPVCDTLNLDRVPTGAAPFSVAFAVNGSDPDGTVSKVTIDFGDGPAQEITQGSGIGTKSVAVQVSHTYSNPGTFTAKATLTDDGGTVSSGTTCTKTITVTQPTPGAPQPTGGKGAPEATPSAAPTAVPTAVPSPTPVAQSTIAPTGPGDTLLGIGVVGVFLTVVGTILLFAL